MTLMPAAAWANGVPDAIEGAVTVTAEKLIDEVVEHPELVIIDARLNSDRVQGFIEGSINITDSNTNCNVLAKHLTKQSHPVMFYCNGIKCKRSANSVRKAVACGYNKIYWLRGGFNEWKTKGFPYLSK